MSKPNVEQLARFSQLYWQHHARVDRCVAGLGLPRDLCQDILQDTWTTAHLRLADLVVHPRPDAWLCSVARNHSRHYLRSGLRYEKKLAAASVAPDRRDHADPHGEHDAWEALASLLRDCPVEQRDVFIKVEIHGMTTAEVAAELGISANTVQSRLRLCRQRLQNVGAALAAMLLALRSRPGGPLMLAERAGLAVSASAAGLGARPLLALACSLLLTSNGSLERPPEPVWVERIAAAADGEAPTPTISVHRPDAVSPAPPPPEVDPPPLPRAESRPPPLRKSPRRIQPPSRVADPISAHDDGEALLRAAHNAYSRGREQRALTLVVRHRKRFPASELRVSREVLAAVLLCHLDRDDDARRQVRTLSLENPDDAVFRGHLGRLRPSCR